VSSSQTMEHDKCIIIFHDGNGLLLHVSCHMLFAWPLSPLSIIWLIHCPAKHITNMHKKLTRSLMQNISFYSTAYVAHGDHIAMQNTCQNPINVLWYLLGFVLLYLRHWYDTGFMCIDPFWILCTGKYLAAKYIVQKLC
jgi:hypothetical protein